jgi:hypothetical protein
VSNHGARQVGGACGALQALRPIAQYARSQGSALACERCNGLADAMLAQRRSFSTAACARAPT